MYELMEKVKEICNTTDKTNYDKNFKESLKCVDAFKSRGGEKTHARNALLKVSYHFRNIDNDIAADCVNEVLAVIDGDNKDIPPVWS